MRLQDRIDVYDARLRIFTPYHKDIFSHDSGQQEVVAAAIAESAEAMEAAPILIHIAREQLDQTQCSVMGAVTLANAIFDEAQDGKISIDQAKEYAARLAKVNIASWGNRGSEAHLMYLSALEDLGHITYRGDSYRFGSQGLPKISTPYVPTAAQS